MKTYIFPFILIFAVFGFISKAPAQDAPAAAEQPPQQEAPAETQTPPAPTPAGEIMGEDDRLEFMQNKDSAESGEPTSGGLLLKTFGAMFLIIGLLFFGAWGAKKYGLFGSKTLASEDAPDLKIMSTVAVAGGQTISAVRFGERILLVGSTAQSFTLLAEDFGAPEENTFEKTPKSVSDLLAEENSSFGKEFSRAQSRLNSGFDGGGAI